MKHYLDIFLRAVLTGFAIGIGGAVNLSCDNKYVGAFLFGTGLFVILFFGFSLFTGKVGYAVENPPSYLADLAVIWLGNLVGTALTGWLILLTRIAPIGERAAGMCETKLGDSVISILILSFFCGMLMFIAADGFKTIANPIAQVLVIFLPVTVFILSGFEHCVANMFYFTVGSAWSGKAFLYLLLMSLGNAAGGVFIPLMRRGFLKK
ncbi:MAG: formate/nitrite transporter family protein [Bacteroides sp.]|nr:formate/nitrite transporter family protein [Eubacterium sp.]MCM1418824.1 formate/nitrite transporter family protein [Roseburia sp.]MCM1462098.1 formate/nitrite transporter family protein [Bacteroides sp.]